MNTPKIKSIFPFAKRISLSAFFTVIALVFFPVITALAHTTEPPVLPPPTVCVAPVDVMLVLDRSGSMAHDERGFPIYPQPLAAVKSGATAFINTLSETNDTVGLVSFSEHATVNSPLVNNFDLVKSQINSLTADGWTNIGEAIAKADGELSQNGRADAKKVIVLLSDGNSNRPLPESAALADALAKAAEAKSHGVTIYSIALGIFDENELKSISSGTGFYYHAPTTEELNAIYLAISAKECERIPATAEGTVFEDINENGVRDLGEPGLSDWAIILKDKKTENPASDRSVTGNSEGKYIFNDVADGTYDVCAIIASEFEQTAPVTSSKCHENIVVSEGDKIENLDFGFAEIHINARPIANAGPDRTVTLGEDVILDGSGSTDDGEITLYEWNFGDGSTTTKDVGTTTHVFTATSTHTITLIVTDNEGAISDPDTAVITVVTQCSDGKDNDGDNKIDFPADPGCSSPDDNDERDVNARPVADAGSYGIMTLGDKVILDGSGSTDDGEVVLYEWNFGDESPLEATSTSATPHIYTATSTYTVTLVVTDDEGAISDPDTATITVATQCSDGKDNDGDHKIDYPTDPGCSSPDDNDEKDVNVRPIADAGPDKVVTLGDDEPFDGSHSFDNDGEIVSYYWNFGDGSTTTKNVATTTHAYTATSTFTVQLIVTDNEGATSTPDTVTVTIAPQCFDGKDNDGDHKIDYPTDPGCRWYDDNDERDVNARPIADAGPDKIVTLGDAVTLDGSGSTDDKKIVSYEWNFGDGSTTTSAIATTTRTYTATSTYTVTLTVTDDEGVISDPDTAVITVATQCSDGKDNDGDGKIDYPTDPGCDSPDDNDEADNKLPIAVLSASPTSDLPNKPISLNGTGSHDPDGTIALYEWNFGDGVIATTTTASTTSHTYGTPNTYTVTLVVTDNEGATSTPATQTITITTPPTGCVSNCGGGGGGGGGGSVIQPSLQITNEVVEKGPVSGTALVKWQTNLPADSRVAYGTSSVTVFPIGDSKYGYQIDTTTLSNLITSHTMAIFGLNPNLTYYFRPLSKTSTLSAIGKELTLAPSECYYLREFIKYGANNNPIEVKKLQVFLNEFEGAKLDVTGFYDLASWNAVTLFQNKYKTNVLDPWGNTPLGYVYLTTRKQVNEIYCRAAFPLDANQTTEVNAYRALMESLRAQGIVSPEGTVLGASDNTSTEIASVSSEQADIGTTTAAKTETGKTPSVTNRGAFTNMLGSAYGSVAGTVSSNWLSLLLLLILIPTGVYAVKLYREEEPISKIFDEGKEEPADDDLGFGTMEEEYPDDII